jgi:CHAT domain-containing protein
MCPHQQTLRAVLTAAALVLASWSNAQTPSFRPPEPPVVARADRPGPDAIYSNDPKVAIIYQANRGIAWWDRKPPDFVRAMPEFITTLNTVEVFSLPNPNRSPQELAAESLQLKDIMRRSARFMYNAAELEKNKQLCAANDCVGRAWQQSEKVKSRLLRRKLLLHDLQHLAPADEQRARALITQQEDLLRQRITGAVVPDEQVAALTSAIARLLPSYAYLGPRLPTPSQIQPLLASNEVLLSFFYTDNGRAIYVWIITPQEAHVEKLLVRTYDFFALAEQARRLAEAGAPLECVRTSLLPLVAALAEKIHLPENARLIIATDQNLSTLPLALLPWDNGRALGDAFELTYVPSATLFYHLRRTKRDARFTTTYAAFAAAEPAEGNTEIRSVGSLFEHPIIVPNATAEAVQAHRDTIAGARYLHFVAHNRTNGEIEDVQLEFGEESHLTSDAILALDNHAQVVLLPACETIAPDDPYAAKLAEAPSCNGQPLLESDLRCICSFGESFSDLSGAFFAAGSRHLLLSQWAIRDERATTEFMKRFVNALTQGQSPTQALRETQRIMRERHPEPAYWAGFIIAGD